MNREHPHKIPKINIQNFNNDFYIKAYKDVPKKSHLWSHYQSNGINENRLPSINMFRQLYPNFDENIYARHNRDISGLSIEQMMSHFHHHGQFEDRIHQKKSSNSSNLSNSSSSEIVEKKNNRMGKSIHENKINSIHPENKKYYEIDTLNTIDLSNLSFGSQSNRKSVQPTQKNVDISNNSSGSDDDEMNSFELSKKKVLKKINGNGMNDYETSINDNIKIAKSNIQRGQSRMSEFNMGHNLIINAPIDKKKKKFEKIDVDLLVSTNLNREFDFIQKKRDNSSIELKSPKQLKMHNYMESKHLSKLIKPLIYDWTYDINSKLYELLGKKNLNKPIYLITSDWGYPPFGGGECWLIDTAKWMLENGYECYYIYFKDHETGAYFDEIKTFKFDYGHYIQFNQNQIELLQFIRLLNPKVISHQGLSRQKHMRIANVLGIPFVTGFCFWQDIIHMNSSGGQIYNQNMMNRSLEADENLKIIREKSAYCYVGGPFVQKIVQKVHGFDIDVINTISDEVHYQLSEEHLCQTPVYVTVINICGLKGGNILERLIVQSNLNIPFLLVDSQNGRDGLSEKMEKLISKRNLIETGYKSIYIKGPTSNIKDIYAKTKILLVTSLVDETFCRVAYEGMMNNIPILSTINGNLRYLLNGYADFLSENPDEWAKKINQIYDDDDYLKHMQNRPQTLSLNGDKDKFIKQINYCAQNPVDQTQFEKNIAIFCPWADQGLGIQCREYYDILNSMGYNVYIYSFKPYQGNSNNPRLQINPDEWDYKNIYYSECNREDTNLNEMIDFINLNKIKKMVIVETCYPKVFEVAQICKLLNVKVYSIPNLETIRYTEVVKHNLFDKIICNNHMTYEIMKYYFPEKACHLGFRILSPYFSTNKKLNKNYNSFFCCGGLNSISRKNIDKIINAFKELENENKTGNFKLYVYVQGSEIPPILNKLSSKNIVTKVGSRSYGEIAKLYQEHDILIHMGDHEGLGLGFYESLASNTPVMTIDTPPNNEIIHENKNGWLVPCKHISLTDNNEGIVKKALIEVSDVKDKMIEIINYYNREEMQNSVAQDYLERFDIEEYKKKILEIFD